MGWAAGQLSKSFTALAAIEFDLGEDFRPGASATTRCATWRMRQLGREP